MKVLHIIQRYPPAIGGSEVWCRNVCRFLSARGVVNRVITIDLFNVEEFFRDLSETEKFVALGAHDLDGGIPVRRYRLSSLACKGIGTRVLNFILYKSPLSALELSSIIRHSPHSLEMYRNLFKEVRDADIVHLHTLPYFHTLAGFWVARLMGKKTVVTPHFHPRNPYYEKKIFFRMLSRCDRVICMSAYEKEYLAGKGISSDRICVAGNSILDDEYPQGRDFEDYTSALFRDYAIAASAQKIIFLGRKEPYKGIAELLKAAGMIVKEDRKAELCLFFVGPSTSAFEKEIGELKGLPRLKVIDFGAVCEKEKQYLLRLSDVLVLPSAFEAFGIVFLEAWRYGKPVIGSDRGAIPEVIKGAGLCVEYGNARDLADKIKLVLRDKALAARLGQSGKDRLDSIYSFNTIGGKVLDAYRAIVKTKKTVLLVSHLFPPYFIGGSEIVAYYQSRRLREKGYDIRVFAGRLDNRLHRYGVNREHGEFDVTRINLHARDFDCYSMNFDKPALQDAFRRVIDQVRPDVVHFHNIYSFSLRMIEECQKACIPTLMTLHDYWGVCFKNILVTDSGHLCRDAEPSCSRCRENFYSDEGAAMSLQERNRLFVKYLNDIDLLMAPSRFLLDQFRARGILEQKSALVRYGIDTGSFSTVRKSFSRRIRFSYIGQIAQHKGTDILLRAIALLTDRERARISVTIVGGGEAAFVEYCARLVSELKISGCVRFAGKVPNSRIKGILSDTDVLVVTSVWFENSPVVILEALASGTPVLGADIGGIPEFVVPGVTGFLHRHDDPAALAENIRAVIANPQVIRDLRQGCLDKARENDLSGPVEKIAGYYEDLASRPAAAATGL